MVFLEFIFSSLWRFVGTVILLFILVPWPWLPKKIVHNSATIRVPKEELGTKKEGEDS